MINPFAKKFSSEELELFKFLSKIKFFEKLKNEEMAYFIPSIHFRKFQKDEVVFFRNDPSQAFYMVKSGVVKLAIDVKGEFETILTIKAGGSFGENSLLEGAKRIYTAIASSDEVELMVIPRFSIQEIFNSHQRIKAKMMTSLAEFNDRNNQRLFKSYKNSFGFFNIGEMFESKT
jgi:CRP/FNR family transcriptional regulator, cyclic AMP receptor protein